jgi:mucolipin 3
VQFSAVYGEAAQHVRRSRKKKAVMILTCGFLRSGTLGTIDFGVQIGLSVFLLLWSIGSVVLSVRALLRGWRHYSLVKRLFQELPENVIGKYTPHYSDWKSLPFSLKRKFASFWNLWNLVGNVLLIIASVLCFMIYGSDNVDLDMAYIVALGLGTFFTLINLTRYFELFRHFSVLINTLRVSFRRVIALLVSVMPVFFAFVLLGLAIFSNFSQVLFFFSFFFLFFFFSKQKKT